VEDDRGAQRHVNPVAHGDDLHVGGRRLVIGAHRPARRYAPASLDRMVVILVIVVGGLLGDEPADAGREQERGEEEQAGSRRRAQVTSLHDMVLGGGGETGCGLRPGWITYGLPNPQLGDRPVGYWIGVLLATIGATLILSALAFVSTLVGVLINAMIVIVSGPLIDRLLN